jgi:hypothetical protein
VKHLYRVIAAIGIIGVVFAIPIAYDYVHSYPPDFEVKLLPKAARILATSEVEQILAGEFRHFRDVRQVPNAVQQAFSTLRDEPFAMVNPGKDMSTDMIYPGLPNKRLVFLALADDKAVLVYEQGAFSNFYCATVFWYGESGGFWGASLEDHSVYDVIGLKIAIQKGRFTVWKDFRQKVN